MSSTAFEEGIRYGRMKREMSAIIDKIRKYHFSAVSFQCDGPEAVALMEKAAIDNKDFENLYSKCVSILWTRNKIEQLGEIAELVESFDCQYQSLQKLLGDGHA